MSVGVLLTGLVACTAPDVHPAPTPEFQQTALLGPHPTLSPLPLPQARARAAGPPPPSESSAAKLLPSLSGGSFDPDRGADLLSALEGLPEDRKSLGLQGVNGDDLYGDLCEDPGVLLELEEGGVRYEASLTVPWGNWLQSWPVPRMIQLSEACAAALNGEGVDSTTCSDEEEAAFFPTGSTCRDCLSGGSDYSSCTADQSCATEAMQQLRAGGTWYGVLSAQALLCAPDFVDEVLILVQDMKEGDPLPEPFDHGAIQAICFPGWDGEGVGLWCDQGVAMALGDLLFHRADYIREEGSSDLTWGGR
ncbi:MAG TPA: hypothetical protein PKW90_10775, partial [Myxococcota bacterium]|nr:hypothetical protein [Myxococcota bacterium]